MGTLDISVCELSMVDGQLIVEVKSSYGDVFLGGQNYDNEIVKWLIEEFKSEHDGFDLSKDPQAYTRIVEAAEKAKCELSSTPTTEINLPYITPIDGVPQHLVKTLTRAKFEQLTADITAKAIQCTRTAIEKANKEIKDIDSILLVGGSTRMNAVKESLTKELGINIIPTSGEFPDRAVALGAVIQANTCVGGTSSTDILLLDVTSLAFGIETEGGIFTKLIDENTTIPTSKTEIFTTAANNQDTVRICVYNGCRALVKDCRLLGEFNLGGILPAPRGVPQIAVTLDIDANGLLKVSAEDKATGKKNNITITSGNSLSKEEIEKIKADAEKFKEEDERKKAEIEELNSAESFAYMIKKTVEDPDLKDKIDEADKTTALDKINVLLEAITKKDLDAVKTAKSDLETFYQSISDKIYANQPQPEQPVQENPTNENASANSDNTSSENVQDVEFEEVK